MLSKQVAVQLRLVRAILRAERRHGTATPQLAERASAIVEQTALAIEPDVDPELTELLARVRAEVAELAGD